MGAEAKATHLMMSKVFSTCNLPISISKSKSKSFKLVPHHNSKIYAASFKKNIDSSQPQVYIHTYTHTHTILYYYTILYCQENFEDKEINKMNSLINYIQQLVNIAFSHASLIVFRL